ncbi:g8364 [Coccomyxa elongata]
MPPHMNLPDFHASPAAAFTAVPGLQEGTVEDFQHSMGIEEFRKNAKDMVDWICDYYASNEELPVRSEVEPGYLRPRLPQTAPQHPENFNSIMQDVHAHIMPGITHWQSPNFFAYFPSNSSFPAMLGEMLSTALSTVGFCWIGSPATTELETIVMDWLGKLLCLPTSFLAFDEQGKRGLGGGVIQGSASESTLVSLLAARARALAGRPMDDAGRLVAYSSDQAHSSIKKACMVAGTPYVRIIPASPEHDYAFDAVALEEAIREDLEAGLLPFYVTATIGTTSSCAVDPIAHIGRITQQYGLWLHVDAAYAGVTSMLPECRHHFEGLELVDSFITNGHKWLLTNFDCSCMWVRNAEPLKAALSLTPAYLRGKGNDLDYKDWQVPLGRRFRSLKLWFVLRSYGTENIKKFLRHHIDLGKLFVSLIQTDARLEIVAPPRWGLICFRLRGPGNEATTELLERVNKSGKAFLVHTELSGRYVARMAIGGSLTQERHVRAAWQLISQCATEVLAARAQRKGI